MLARWSLLPGCGVNGDMATVYVLWGECSVTQALKIISGCVVVE